MSPRSVVFSGDRVCRAALQLVREDGWAALTARGLAKRLGSSVAPVYSAFGSMSELETRVLRDSLRMLDASMSRPWAASSFLSMGVGLAVFARDERQLFLALYRTGGSRSDMLGRFKASLLERLRSDTVMSRVAPEALERIFERMWVFTIGLALSLIYGHTADASTEGIARTLRSVGGVMIYAELAGIVDDESEEARVAWARLLKARGIDIKPATRRKKR